MFNIFPNEEDEEKNREAALAALAAFTDLYEPANPSFTDLFTSIEIAGIIKAHNGYDFALSELTDLLKNMGYKYELQEQKFMWMCAKVPA